MYLALKFIRVSTPGVSYVEKRSHLDVLSQSAVTVL